MFFSNQLKIIALSLMLIVITGCMPNAPREVIFNEGGPTMSEIYRGHDTIRAVEQQVGYSNAGPLNEASAQGIEHYTRDAGNEIDFLFPELENPRLVMYVFAHTSENGHPIPGYSTAFYLYDGTQNFALPGEVLP